MVFNEVVSSSLFNVAPHFATSYFPGSPQQNSQMPLIEYTKTVNSTASLVAAISNIQYSEIFLLKTIWTIEQ